MWEHWGFLSIEEKQWAGTEARTFGSYSGKNETLFPSDVRLGRAAVPHDIIQRFPWYPLIGCPRVNQKGEGGARACGPSSDQVGVAIQQSFTAVGFIYELFL